MIESLDEKALGLYDLRIKADYDRERVTLEEASDAFDVAPNLVATVLKVH